MRLVRILLILILFNNFLASCNTLESSSHRSLSNSDPATRRKAIAALAQDKDPKRVAELAGILRQDADASVREAAAEALGEIGAPAAVSPLLYAAQHDDQLMVRHGAMKALGRIGGEEAIAGIIQLWRVHRDLSDGAIHLSGSDALVRIGKASIPALRAGLADPVWRVRWMAVGTLRQLKDPSVRPDIEKLLSDPHSMVRNEAESALEALR